MLLDVLCLSFVSNADWFPRIEAAVPKDQRWWTWENPIPWRTHAPDQSQGGCPSAPQVPARFSTALRPSRRAQTPSTIKTLYLLPGWRQRAPVWRWRRRRGSCRKSRTGERRVLIRDLSVSEDQFSILDYFENKNRWMSQLKRITPTLSHQQSSWFLLV